MHHLHLEGEGPVEPPLLAASFEPLGELGQLLLHGHGAARGLRALPGLLQALLVVVRVQEAKHGILEGRVNHPVAGLAQVQLKEYIQVLSFNKVSVEYFLKSSQPPGHVKPEIDQQKSEYGP